MNKKCRVTDVTIRGLKAAPAGKRVEVWDELVSGFGVRVTDTGKKSFVLYTRFNGEPSRRKIGDVGKISLAEARRKAKEWLELAGQGRDPKAEAQAARLAEEGRATFGAAMEKYIARHVRKTRKAKAVEREIRKELMPRFGRVALVDVTRRDIAKMVGEIRDRGALFQAHHILGHARTFYNWAIAQEEFGVEISPCDRLKPNKLIGPKHHRTRVLADDELRAIWKATGTLGYPLGSLYRLLLLTGARLSEASGARWSEFDLPSRLWTVPPERFKSNATHLVPLAPDAVELLEGLPRWTEGDFVFSTRYGRIPINGFSKAKSGLDALVAEELGRDPEPYVTHDLRRTVRTRLSQLRVPTEIAELVIGHGRKGLAAVYDRHEALDERREALELWGTRLRSIVEPPPPNVVAIERARA
jgi:integrase